MMLRVLSEDWRFENNTVPKTAQKPVDILGEFIRWIKRTEAERAAQVSEGSSRLLELARTCDRLECFLLRSVAVHKVEVQRPELDRHRSCVAVVEEI